MTSITVFAGIVIGMALPETWHLLVRAAVAGLVTTAIFLAVAALRSVGEDT